MKNIIESQRFDIVVSGSNDYKNIERYVVRYGLQVTQHDTLEEAYKEFNSCFLHALACENGGEWL